MSIQQTVDYEVFQKHRSNRPICEKSVQRLMDSIKRSNRLSSKPICVDHNYCIVDGQHRLEAARRLGIPIYFVQEDFKSEDMIEMNANQKNWTISDYLNFYNSVDSKPEYKKLKTFIIEENLPLNIALQLLNGDRSAAFFQNFRDGYYKFPKDLDFTEAMERKSMIKECIEYIKRKTSGPKGYLDKVTFYAGLVDFFNIKSFSYDVFMTKLSYKIDLLHPCTRQCEYVKIFKEIYNWKNQKPIETPVS